jgi:putative restriction endonuclease
VRYRPPVVETGAGDADLPYRLAAFARLEELQRLHGDSIPAAALREGFVHAGERVLFRAQQGIFKPRQMRLPLSIRTSAENPYGDELGPDGFLRYRYQGEDPHRHDNRWLRECMHAAVPLVYLHGLGGATYKPLWPVYIHADDPASLTFTVASDDMQTLAPDLSAGVVDDARRAYVTRLAVRRLHQAAFRQKVLVAYRTRCAVCRLRHQNLLDAAHILPDAHPDGAPIVANGLALCKIHHAAYDANIVGIRPDLVVEISEPVLREVDGPMLRYGLQATHGTRLVVPHRPADQPKPEFLEARYEEFRAAS